MRALIVVAMVCAVALAGCGDKDVGEGGVEFKTPEKNDDGRYVIKVENNAFSPRNAKVPEGAVVVWEVNMDGCRIEARDGAFDSRDGGTGTTTSNTGVIARGGTFTWTAFEEGEHDYWCTGKSSVTGTLRVG